MMSARRDWIVGLARSLAITALGGWGLWVQLTYRRPGTLLFLLPWLSLGLTALSVVMLVNHVLRWAPRRDAARMLYERVEYWGSLTVLTFCCYGLFLFSNGLRDTSIPRSYRSEVLDIVNGELELNIGGSVPVSWAKLRSWSDPAKTMRILLWENERHRLWVGEAVIVKVREGALGLPWIFGIERDYEKYARDVLALTPTATAGWKALVGFYLQERRWAEAGQLTREYLKIYPEDYQFATISAGTLAQAGQVQEVIMILDPLADRHLDYWLYTTLGIALARVGPSERSVALLKDAIAMQPDSAWPYYLLAQVYEEWGRREEAIPVYEKVLQLEPEFQDARYRLNRIRQGKTGLEPSQRGSHPPQDH
jgi:tetratricopeptide (TPR) repeat protein